MGEMDLQGIREVVIQALRAYGGKELLDIGEKVPALATFIVARLERAALPPLRLVPEDGTTMPPAAVVTLRPDVALSKEEIVAKYPQGSPAYPTHSDG